MAGNWHKTDRMWRGGMMMVMSHKGYRRTERFHVNVSKRKLRAKEGKQHGDAIRVEEQPSTPTTDQGIGRVDADALG